MTDDVVITGCDGGEPSHTYALQRATGKVLWKQNRPALQSDLFQVGDAIIGRTWNGDLVALDLGSGAVRWSLKPRDYFFEMGPDESPTMRDGIVYFGAADGAVYAVDGAKGDVQWQRQLDCRVSTSPAVDDSCVYAGCSTGQLFRLARADGRLLAQLDAGARPIGRMAVAGERLIVLLDASTLAAFDLRLSRRLWQQVAEPEWTARQPLVWRDDVIVGDASGRVFAFALADGSKSWSTWVDGMVRGLGAHGDVLYIGTFQGSLFALTRAAP